MTNDNETRVVIWPKHYKPLPKGWQVIQLDCGHYIGVRDDDKETNIHCDRYAVRRWIFAGPEWV